MRRNERGTSFLEMIGATVLFGMALLGSGGLLLQWHHTSARLEERAVAEHALANEMDEVLLHAGALPLGTRSWMSLAAVTSGLEEAEGELLVEPFPETGLRRVVITLRWKGGVAARETLL